MGYYYSLEGYWKLQYDLSLSSATVKQLLDIKEKTRADVCRILHEFRIHMKVLERFFKPEIFSTLTREESKKLEQDYDNAEQQLYALSQQ